MICPGCHADSLQEHSPSCPSCGFDLAAIDGQLGLAPNLRSKVSDFTEALIPAQVRKLERRVQDMSLQFPQCRFAIVFTRIPKPVSLSAYTFWLFNKGGAGAPGETGSLSRLVVLLVDVDGQRSSCMVGYGLEPFFSVSRLDKIARASLPYLHSRSYADAAEAMLDQLQDELLTLSSSIAQTFGLEEPPPTSISTNGEEVFAY